MWSVPLKRKVAPVLDARTARRFRDSPSKSSIAETLQRSSRHFYFVLHLQAAWFFLAMVATASKIATIPPVTPLVPPLALVSAFVYLAMGFARAVIDRAHSCAVLLS
jgi:hypothetical protein